MIKMSLGVFVFFLTCSVSAVAQNIERFEFVAKKMGTTIHIIFYSADSILAKRAVDSCWLRIDQLNQVFSDYLEESEIVQLSQFSNTGNWTSVSDDLWLVMRFSHLLSTRTDGIFDLTIGPLSKLWRRAIRRQTLPSEKELQEASRSVGFRFIEYDTIHQAVRLLKENMRLDAGGIAKGYTADQLFKVLGCFGINQALVDAGGDIYAGMPPPGKTEWVVNIESEKRNIGLKNKAVASSGDTYQYFISGDTRYAHIVNPITGIGAKNLVSVNIKAENAMTADALASVICLLGKEKSNKFLGAYSYEYLK